MKNGSSSADEPFLYVERAQSFWSRFCGLMGRPRLPENQALLIAPCSSVHMCFMRFSIDVIYLDREYRILKLVQNLRPWTGLSLCFGAWAVLEAPSGTVIASGYQEGMQFEIET